MAPPNLPDWWSQMLELLLARSGWRPSLQHTLKDPDYRWQLRGRFLEQAKHYIGIPYAKRYHEPGTPEYESLLFLDCCGLVRRVMRDLKSEFGFLIGPGNQAYQYDTLPVSLSREEDMKPADLVFISGTYFNPQRKRQIHDMVHVEIWLGDGRATLGARWQRGTVQVFDSYRFDSTSYGDMKYHFKSIETWLQGSCVSHCPEHRWESSAVPYGKRSIFYPWDDHQEPAEEGLEDPSEGAEGDRAMQITDGEVAHPTEAALRGQEEVAGGDVPVILGPEPTGTNDYIDATSRDGHGLILDLPKSVSRQGSNKALSVNVPQNKGSEEATDPRRPQKTAQKPERVSESKEKNASAKLSNDLAKNSNSSTKLNCKAVTAAKKKKTRGLPLAAKGAQQDGSTAGDAAALGCTDAEPLDEARVKEMKTDPKGVMEAAVLGEKKPEDPRGPGPFFYIGGSNGAQLVNAYCLKRGWQRLQDSSRGDYKLKWCEVKSSATYRAFREGEQLVYQIPNNKILTTKIGLLSSLREYEKVMNKLGGLRSARLLRLEEFFPETLRLDLKDERDAFFTFYKEGQLWICKPTGMNQGRGIFLLKNQEEISTLRTQLQSLEEDPMYRKVGYKSSQARIVQRYIQKPLLLAGRKFDVRSYLLIASTVPYSVFFRHGYVRLTCSSYDPHSDDLTDHLTNQYMQKKNPLYHELKEDTVWSMERFNQYVNEKFAAAKGLPPDWVLTLFTKRMQQIMLHCFLAVKNKLDCKVGLFDLMGCDFLIDEDFKVWFLEMNCNPALHTNCEVLKDVIPNVVDETLDLALEIFHKTVKGHRILPLETLRSFVLLYNADSPDQGLKLTRSKTVSPPKIQRMLRSDGDELSQSASKAPEKTQRKSWSSVDNPIGSGAKNPSNKVLSRTVLPLSQVQVAEIPSTCVPQSVKPKTNYESTANSLRNANPEMGCESCDHARDCSPRGKSPLTTRHSCTLDNTSPTLPRKSRNTFPKISDQAFPLSLHLKAPDTDQSSGLLEPMAACEVKEMAPADVKVAAVGSPGAEENHFPSETRDLSPTVD